MEILIVLALVLLIAIVAPGQLAAYRARRPSPLIAEKVLVNTRKPDNQSVRGLLVQNDPKWIRLEAPEYMDGETPVRLDGEVLIATDHVSFVQVL